MIKIIISVLNNRSLLIPTYKLKNTQQIASIPELLNEQKKIYIFDKDDTLVPLHQFQIRDEEINKLINILKSKDKSIYIVSNSVRNHGKKIRYTGINQKQETIDIMCTIKKKPYNIVQIQQNIKKDIPKSQDYEQKNTVIVGDRLLTDIVLGNMQGWTTVLVNPIQNTSIKKHGLGVYMMRKFQNIILNYYSRQNQKK